MQRLLGANRDFTLLWAGQAISVLGGNATLIALPLLLTTHHSPSAAGFVFSLMSLTGLASALPAGVLVDRVDKRRLMLGCDLVRAAGMGLLAVEIGRHQAGLALIAVVAVVSAVAGSVFGCAEGPAVRHIVPADSLALAFARNEARGAAAALCGPLVGGGLYAIDAQLPFIADAASFAVSFFAIALIRTAMQSSMDRRSAVHRDLAQGLSFVWRQSFLRVCLILVAGLNFASNALFLLVIVASRERGDGAGTTSLLVTMGAIGSLVGAAAAPRLVTRLSVHTILTLNRLMWTVFIATLLIVHDTYIVGVFVALMYFLGPTGNTALITRQMAVTPDDLQGRAASARGLVAGVAAPIGLAVIGPVYDASGRTGAVLLLACWMFLMTAIAWSSRAVRAQARAPAAV